MKSSRNFATAYGQSHLRKNMANVSLELKTLPNTEGGCLPMYELELSRFDQTKPTFFKVRLTSWEANYLRRRLAEALDKEETI